MDKKIKHLQNIKHKIKKTVDTISTNAKDITSTSIDKANVFWENVTDIADTVSEKSIKAKNSISENYDNTSQYITLTPEEQKRLIANCAKFFPPTRVLNLLNALKNAESYKHDKTLRNYALFASHVYRKNDTKLPNGWKELAKLDDSETGLQSTLYKRIGSKDYIYAFAGTQNLKDWKENGKQIVGSSPQYKKALEYAREIYKNYEFDSLTFVGHSQGGGEAAFCAHVLGGKAITFNPAGMSVITKLLNRTTNSNKAKIDAYCYLTDTLNIVQELTAIIPFFGLKADGKIHFIYDKFPQEMSIGEFHGMKGFLSYFEE